MAEASKEAEEKVETCVLLSEDEDPREKRGKTETKEEKLPKDATLPWGIQYDIKMKQAIHRKRVNTENQRKIAVATAGMSEAINLKVEKKRMETGGLVGENDGPCEKRRKIETYQEKLPKDATSPWGIQPCRMMRRAINQYAPNAENQRNTAVATADKCVQAEGFGLEYIILTKNEELDKLKHALKEQEEENDDRWSHMHRRFRDFERRKKELEQIVEKQKQELTTLKATIKKNEDELEVKMRVVRNHVCGDIREALTETENILQEITKDQNKYFRMTEGRTNKLKGILAELT